MKPFTLENELAIRIKSRAFCYNKVYQKLKKEEEKEYTPAEFCEVIQSLIEEVTYYERLIKEDLEIVKMLDDHKITDNLYDKLEKIIDEMLDEANEEQKEERSISQQPISML